MSILNGFFTSESVSAGHPDKLCDCISDAILDQFMARDKKARVACETFVTNGKIIVAGEFRTSDPAHFKEVEALAPEIVRRTLRKIGYGKDAFDIDPDTCEIEVRFNQQSPQIAAAVDKEYDILGAGDQGIVFGYACDETAFLMPFALSLAQELITAGTRLVHEPKSLLRPDAKSQVTVVYNNGEIVGVKTVVLSWQHQPGVSIEKVRDYLTSEVLDRVISKDIRTSGFRAFINASGPWVIGGPKGDTGLTGRKIVVDTYGGACPHGGGAFSGKDPSKLDRSGAYAARWVAKTVVAAGLARRCTVQLSYALGEPEPLSVSVNLHGTGRVADWIVSSAVEAVFDLSPAAIIRDLDLLNTSYESKARSGHFGAVAGLWEQTGRASQLKEEVTKQIQALSCTRSPRSMAEAMLLGSNFGAD